MTDESARPSDLEHAAHKRTGEAAAFPLPEPGDPAVDDPAGERLAEAARSLLASEAPDLEDLLDLALAALRHEAQRQAGAGAAEHGFTIHSTLSRIPARVISKLRAPGSLASLAPRLEQELEDLEARFEQVRAREAGSPLDELTALLSEARLLREVAALMKDRAPDDPLRDLLGSLAWVERELENLRARLGPTSPHQSECASVEKEARRVRLLATRRRLGRYRSALRTLARQGGSEIERAWHELQGAPERIAEARTAIERAQPLPGEKGRRSASDSADPDGAPSARTEARLDLEREVAGIEVERAAVRASLEKGLSAAPEGDRHRHLEGWAEDLAEATRNAMGYAEEASPDAATAAIRMREETAAWLLGLIDGERRRVPGSAPLRRAWKLARRARRRLANELVELSVQSGMERAFGRRFVTSLEGIILWLIFAVTGLIAFESLFGSRLSTTGEAVLAAIDLGICAIFVAEFCVRLRFASRKLRFTARHFLTDLLPAVPFGIIVFLLEPYMHAADRGAGLTGAFEVAQLGHLLFYLRLARLARYLKAARPVIRFARLFVFFQRGLDHVVKRSRALMDREIVLFAPPRTAPDEPRAIELRFADLARRTERVVRGTILGLPHVERLSVVRRLVLYLEGRIRGLPPPTAQADPVLAARLQASAAEAAEAAEAREVPLEEVIQELVRADAAVVEEVIGRALGERIARLLGLLDLPGIRAIGPLGRIVRAGGEDPLGRTAQAARELGIVLDRLVGAVKTFADLRGIVTGPQLVDRVGSTVIKATEKPAKRLLTMGLLFIAANVLVHWLGFDLLSAVLKWVTKVLGIPVIVIGFIALVLMHLGKWFKKVAGEATDVYDRVAEAQYVNLLVFEKHRYIAQDMARLWSRALLPEEAALVPLGDEAAFAALEERACALLVREVTDSEDGIADGQGPDAAPLKRSIDDSYERAILLYRDYLSGAPLHVSDTKTSQQLLGNLTLLAIQTERLRLTAKEKKALLKLDLDRGGVTGPFLWFNFITLALTEQTAKLLMEYNRYCQPLLERAARGEEVSREFEAWVARRRAVAGREETAEERRASEEERRSVSHYASTAFNALDFLTVDPAREARIARRFGRDVLRLLRRDRRALARTVFGSYPLHQLPRPQRVLNPFALYVRHVASGRVLLLPLTLLRLAGRGIGLAFRKLGGVIKDVVVRRSTASTLLIAPDPDAAIRKINRMRQPIVEASMDLRARFDPEYLGVLTPGAPPGTDETATWEEDLFRIDASEALRRGFRERRRAAERLLTRFIRLMREEPGTFEQRPSPAVLSLPGAPLPHESLRAAWVAFAIDYRSCRALIEAAERVEDRLREIAEGGEALPGRGGRAVHIALRAVKETLLRRRDRRRAAFRVIWQSWHDALDLEPERRREVGVEVYFAIVRDKALARDAILLADQGGLALARRTSLRILGGVLKSPVSWTEQLVAIRTVQTLAMLDLRNYRDLVLRLCAFGEEDDEPAPAPAASEGAAVEAREAARSADPP